MVLNYYKDQLRLYDIVIAQAPTYYYSTLIDAYPTLFQYNTHGQFVILNNLELFKIQVSPVIQGRTGYEDSNILELLGQFL